MPTVADIRHRSGDGSADDHRREAALVARYGELVSLHEIAFELKIPSAEAVLRSFERGRLGLSLFQIPPRRAFYAHTRALARLMNAPGDKAVKGEAS